MTPGIRQPRGCMEILLARGATVNYNDPYIPLCPVGPDLFHPGELTLESMPLSEEPLKEQDCVVIVAGHSLYDYAWIAAHAPDSGCCRWYEACDQQP